MEELPAGELPGWTLPVIPLVDPAEAPVTPSPEKDVELVVSPAVPPSAPNAAALRWPNFGRSPLQASATSSDMLTAHHLYES